MPRIRPRPGHSGSPTPPAARRSSASSVRAAGSWPLVATLVAATLVTPLAGCRMFAYPAAHTTAEHEAYYHRKVAEVDACPSVDCPIDQPQLFGEEPVVRDRVPADYESAEFHPMTLQAAVRTAMMNNRVIRQDAQFSSPANPILTNADFTSSVFDPAIQDTNILFGNRGIGAAHSDFSPQLTGSYTFGRNDSVVNVGTPTPTSERTRNFDMRLEKQLHFGGTLGLNSDVDFSDTNSPVVGLDRTYTGSLSADFTMPLLAAFGTEFTQIAGPAAFISPRITSVNQGILIARITSEVARVDLEQNIRSLVLDTVNLYWDLSLAHSRAQTEAQAIRDAEQVLKKARALFDTGRSTAAEEAEAADAYHAAVVRGEQALRGLETTERRFRRLLGLDVSDTRLILPADEPYLVTLPKMWNPLLADALHRRPQLRRSKHNIRSLQLQLKAAKSLNRPRLDLTSSYRVNGFGESKFRDRTVDSLFDSATSGELNGFTAGVQFSMPLDFQLQRSQVDNIELRLAKSRLQLAEAETEVAHELAFSYQEAQRLVRIARSNLKRRDASTRLVRSLEAEFETDRGDIDRLVRAQARQAEAENAYRESLTEFSKALAAVDNRRSALLERTGVVLDFPDIPVAEDLDCRPTPLTRLHHGNRPPRLPAQNITSDPRLGEIGPPTRTYDPNAALPAPDESTLGNPRSVPEGSPYTDDQDPEPGENLDDLDELEDAPKPPSPDEREAPSPLLDSPGDRQLPDLYDDTRPRDFLPDDTMDLEIPDEAVPDMDLLDGDRPDDGFRPRTPAPEPGPEERNPFDAAGLKPPAVGEQVTPSANWQPVSRPQRPTRSAQRTTARPSAIRRASHRVINPAAASRETVADPAKPASLRPVPQSPTRLTPPESLQ